MHFFSCRASARLLKEFGKKSSMEMKCSYFTFCNHRYGCRWGASHAKLAAVSKTFLLEWCLEAYGILLEISVDIFAMLGESQLSCEQSLNADGWFWWKMYAVEVDVGRWEKDVQRNFQNQPYCLPHKIRPLKKPQTFKEGEGISLTPRARYLD